MRRSTFPAATRSTGSTSRGRSSTTGTTTASTWAPGRTSDFSSARAGDNTSAPRYSDGTNLPHPGTPPMRIRVTFAVLVLLLATGCLPDAVVWVPDGKSLVWTEDRGTRVVLYALAKKERHGVEDNTNSQTTWPAVSPDGTLFAVARAVRAGVEPSTMEIVLLTCGRCEVQ